VPVAVSTREEEAMGHSDKMGRLSDLCTSPRPAPSQAIVEIAEGAERVLRNNAYLALKNVTCEYREGVLTLRGCLPTYYLKQMAQTAVAHLKGVRQVVNEIEVVAGGRRLSPCP
jgi:osmotically-inducible protein OsmY